jgi:hypothetical protein
MNKSESIAGLSKALAKAQGEVENASKSSANPHFKSKYADLAEVLNTVRPVFCANGLAFVQMPSFESGVVSVETLLTHESGEWISNVASAPVTKQDAQGVGSAITYLRRYSLAAFAGVAQEDDDANASIGNQNKQAKKPSPPIPHHAEQAPPNEEEYLQLCESFGEQIAEIRIGINKKDYARAYYAWSSLGEESQAKLWRAPTKGGCFTTEERAIMKSPEFRQAYQPKQD